MSKGIAVCKKCGSLPELVTPRYQGLYDDMPTMMRPIGPENPSDKWQREQFQRSHPPYFRCPMCPQIEALESHLELIKKWNEEQQS